MSLNQAMAVLQTHLISGVDYEIAGSDPVAGVSYRVTTRRGDIDFAPFSVIAPDTLRTLIEDGLPLSIGATLYRIERSFGPAFLGAVRESRRVFAISVTVQSPTQIVCFLGRDAAPLLATLGAYIPPAVEWDRDTLVEGSREWGRKVGHAAKDLAGMRDAMLDLVQLELLERSGEIEAYEAARKDAVWPPPAVEVLRLQSVPPVVALGIVSCWRMVKHRPSRGPDHRRAFVHGLPALRAALESCRTLDEFASALQSRLANFADPAAVVGTRLPSFARAVSSHFRKSYARSDATIRALLAVEGAAEEARWALVASALSRKGNEPRPHGPPLPMRVSVPLEQLIRTGPSLLAPPPLAHLSANLGITGLELGNYVSRAGGERLASRLAEAMTDLRGLLGDWIVPLCRVGNLSVALGARGKGKACAHYEPALRVINLTKARGDGSLAHEFAHFLDHMLAPAAVGDSRYLSGRVVHIQSTDHPLAGAMGQVMQALSSSPCGERVIGEVQPNRWFLRRWMKRYGYDPQVPPQASFDRVADALPDKFRGGRRPRANSVMLVNSLAKYAGSPVEVEIIYAAESDFVRSAKSLGVYWSRPQELFARAFESFVEDEAAARGWTTEYLVYGTRLDYSGCRALPYPVGSERERIASAMHLFFDKCNTEQREGAFILS